MTVNFPTKYPATLTNAAWQKYKNALDKAKGKTGLGPALVAAEAAWKAIPFKKLDATTAGAKSAGIATTNLAAAKLAKKTEVKAGLAAVVTAMKAAQAQAKNKALSDKARAGAATIANGLDTLQGYLLNLKLDDMAQEVDRLGAEANAELALHDFDLRRKGGATASGTKGVRAPDGRVTVSGLAWEPTAGNPRKLVQTLITVKAIQPDGSIFVNDMILTALSNDLKQAAFKNP